MELAALLVEPDVETAEGTLRRGAFEEALVLARTLPPGFDRLRLECEARLELGDVPGAEAAANRLLSFAGTELERAQAMLRLGCCSYKRSSVPAAVELFSHALQLCRETPEPSYALRAELLSWRSRCYRHQRHWGAAQADVDAGLELAYAIGDERQVANLVFQSSLLHERTGQTTMACCLAEQARDAYERIGDRRSLARILNNLGGLNHLLGRDDLAVDLLRDAYALASELGNTADAAQAVSSLAQVELSLGAADRAEIAARAAMALLAVRPDYAEELGNATLVLGRALLEQGRLEEARAAVEEAEAVFSGSGSRSCVAAALVARGDVQRRLGRLDEAAELYRHAAELLQDFHF